MKRLLTIKTTLVLLVLALGWSASSQARTVYLQPNTWTTDNAVVSLWIWTDGSDGSWATLTAVEDGIYKAEFDDAINRMIVARGTEDNRWAYNQTDNIDISEVDGKLFNMGDIAAKAYTTEDYTEPLNRTYTVEGVAALLGTGWAAVEANNMTKGDDGTFTLVKENVLLTPGDYTYKVYCAYNDKWYPAGDNKVITIEENGYYTVTFTFDLETADPNATATKTEAIGYLVDFETSANTSVRDFAVASNWKHVADYDSNYDSNMYYSYSTSEGVNGTTALLAYRQFKYDYGASSSGKETYDLLVTPLVSGKITMYVKAYGLASSSNPAFIEFYTMNTQGTEKGSLIQRFTTDTFEPSGIDGWYTVSINVESEQRIGIRAQYVYMDNFLATSATILPEKKLVINSVKDAATSSTSATYNMNEDGTTTIQLLVNLSNTGDVDLNAGDEDFSLSLITKGYYSGTITTYENATANIEQNIAVGETANVTVTLTAPANADMYKSSSYYTYFGVMENVSGTKSSSFVQATIKPYESKFIFDVAGTTYYSSSSATTTPINFGKITEETTVNYEIYNSGSAPLVINSFTLSEPFTSDAPAGEFTVAGGEKKQIAITMPVTTAGVFAGNVEIAYTNFGKEQATYTLGISGTVIDSSKNWITFSNADNTNGQFPAGSIHSDQVYITSSTSGDATNYYLQSTSTTTKFITPLLHAEAGESFTYDTWYSSYNYNCALVVYSSKDRANWTQIDRQTYSGGITNTPKTFTVTLAEAGDYYLAFELAGNALLDNIYGLTLAATPEHDWYVAGSNVPTTGKQNAEYTATMSLKNISGEADVIETATLYVDGEAVATAENIALEANTKTAAVGTGRNDYANIENPVEVAVSYKPHTFGTFPAYIELKSGETVVKSEEVNLVISEEKLESSVSIEGTTTAQRLTVVAPYYNHSGSESLLTQSVLSSMGVNPGAKISRIYVNGYNTSGETTHTTTVWMGNTDATELSSPFTAYDVETNAEGLTKILDEDYVYPVAGTSSATAPILDITLTEPFEYTGGSIRIIAKADIVTTYKQVSLEKSSIANLCQAYSYDNGSLTYSATELPAFNFELVVEPTVLTGTVTDANGAVEGATVTLRNEANDVEYAATTDAEGQYSINVIQNTLAYKAVADADGLVAPVQIVESFDDAVDFELTEPEYGEIWNGEAENADLTAGYFKYLAQEGDIVRVTYTEAAADATTIKFTNNQNWTDVFMYAFNDNGAVGTEWPGDAQNNYALNEYGEQVFTCTIPAGATGLVFNNNAGQQTVDITDLAVTGYYTDGSQTDGKFNVTSWTESNAAVQLLNQSGKAVADATLNEGVAEVALTADIISQLAAGYFANVKGTAATITKVELVKNAVTVTMSSLEHATLYYENVNLVVPEGITAYAAVVGDTKVNLVELATAGGVIPAGVAVVLKGAEGSYEFAVTEDAGTTPAENDLIGSENGGKDDEAGYKYYVLNRKDGVAGFYFQKGSAGEWADVRAHSAYLKVDASLAKAGGFGFTDGAATAIDSIEIGSLTESDKVYTLSGVRVNANRVAKGVYIVNGQKVVIK